ncbi:MAG TPA: type II secretion system protein N [Wenzhouxiangellaceae bacterium]|nr:type II secretion system protein N [Wenzhouxiangellaceae bacterium]
MNRLDRPSTANATCWLLVVVCVLLVARIGIVLVDGVDVEYQPIPFSPSSERVSTLPATDWRMFGDPSEPDYGFAQALPPTPLSLRLRGVVTGERGYAIIVDAEGNEGVYRAGDMVPGDAEVVTIEPRRVVLERNATREALELPGSGASTAVGTAPRARAQSPERNGLAGGAGIGSLTSMTSGFSLDPNELARRITILPVAGGGFRVRAGRDAAIFTQLGFHANDIVLAINGQPVDNQGDVRAVFESFRPGEPLAITVRRGERQLVLTPDLSMLGEAGQR